MNDFLEKPHDLQFQAKKQQITCVHH